MQHVSDLMQYVLHLLYNKAYKSNHQLYHLHGSQLCAQTASTVVRNTTVFSQFKLMIFILSLINKLESVE